MIQAISMERIMKDLKTSDFFLQCRIPIGYSSGFPVLQIKNESLCVTVPYLQYRTTGEVDKTLVFPIRYGITLELPTEKVIGFEDYEYNSSFGNVDFDKPVGYFRHDALKQYNKTQYRKLRKELMGEYDKVANAILSNEPYSATDEKRMAELLQLLVEPSLLLFYRALDVDFYQKYLEEG